MNCARKQETSLVLVDKRDFFRGADDGMPSVSTTLHPRGLAYDFAAQSPMFGGGTAAR